MVEVPPLVSWNVMTLLPVEESTDEPVCDQLTALLPSWTWKDEIGFIGAPPVWAKAAEESRSGRKPRRRNGILAGISIVGGC
jgi:hypothetical protein